VDWTEINYPLLSSVRGTSTELLLCVCAAVIICILSATKTIPFQIRIHGNYLP